MPDIIPFDEITHLFTEFEHTAWRLETKRVYATDRMSPNWTRFQNAETFDYDPANAWQANVRRQTEAGKRFERVRLVDAPPTEGQRFLLATGLGNVTAGEDIRNLYRADAEQLGLPPYDFWLFDARTVVRFVIDDDGVTLGVTVHDDPETVVYACQVRDAAWHFAIPTRQFQAQVPSAR
ncbi:hypothetical protein SAMN05216532_8609 [Streptomyces sp. 2231.1]|uniref:DUF6879 family protein n=1 Tax=Streptomyces sp. 2231.1 TaxID=1855347 RepID=UPI0008942FE6|nr:DUF6879 family protein [Streptomyces sp. 2231.1]SEE69757.1 hypothetical protein SAMN05216532_8461 [Streptomyces sp. 2231.1]SEE73042.1 hypothetical protein SAMN05216532_8609 [Streptomyces sp. 2231.1]